MQDSAEEDAMHRLAAAWQGFEDAVARARRALLESRLMQLAPEDAEGAYRCLAQAQAHAHNLIIAPETDRPVFYFGALFDPWTYTWLAPCPDFFYRMAFVNGSGVYRIRVRANDATWINFHMRSDMWGMPGVEYLGSFDLEEFIAGADGWVEIVASAERLEGNWLPLAPDSAFNFFNIRAAMEDWSGTPPEFHFEVVAEPTLVAPRGAADTARRIERAARFLEFSLVQYTIKPNEDALALAGGVNAFGEFDGAVFQAAGNSPRNHYSTCLFEVGEDEALILETADVAGARYYGVMLADVWNQTLPCHRQQSSLNRRQFVADPDGRVRFVLAHRDPGVPNWLDVVGHRHGVIQLRAHGSKQPILAETRLVPLAEVRAALPAGSGMVSPQQRATTLRRRETQMRRIYGY